MIKLLPGVIRKEKKSVKTRRSKKIKNGNSNSWLKNTRNKFQAKLDVFKHRLYLNEQKNSRRNYTFDLGMWFHCPRYRKIFDSCKKVIDIFASNVLLPKNYMKNYLFYDHKLVEKNFIYEKTKFETNNSSVLEGKPRKKKFYSCETENLIWKLYAKDQF